jgi:ubiquinone/menaquinone biosynthesis C-methylase UbiE
MRKEEESGPQKKIRLISKVYVSPPFIIGLHASVAPLVTRIIDDRAYGGVDARENIAKDLYKAVNKKDAYILDLGCGVGMSTRALASAFNDAAFICGVDTSPEMVDMARYINKNQSSLNAIQDLFGDKSEFAAAFTRLILEVRRTASNTAIVPNCLYAIGNAERILAPKDKFDLVTLFYAFHEIPFSARNRIMREARRLLKPGGKMAIVDICPREYVPVESMLAGEPYVLEYQKNIEKQISRLQGFKDLQVTNCVPGHVRMWLLTRK